MCRTHHNYSAHLLKMLDNSALMCFVIHSSYLAANGATEVGGVQSMSVELARFLRDVNPRHVAVCFDVNRETTFRRMMDPNYKSHRKPYPDDIVMQV